MPPENYFWFHETLPELLDKLGFAMQGYNEYRHKSLPFHVTFDFSETTDIDSFMQYIFTTLIKHGENKKLSEIQQILGIRK